MSNLSELNNNNTEFYLQSELISNDILTKDIQQDLTNQLDSNHENSNTTDPNILYGEVTNDSLYGNSGVDELYGRAGEDRLYGGSGNDLINGGLDDDVIYGDNAFLLNSQTESGGDDRIYGGKGKDLIFGQGGNDKIDAGNQNDTVYGGTGKDTIRGRGGDDYLYGEAGKDRLIGGSGNDTIDGGMGNDVIRLGRGQDTIVLKSGNGLDRVLDFQNGEDKIQLDSGIAYENLKIFDYKGDTLIKNLATKELLLRLKDVSSETIDADDFVLKDTVVSDLEFSSLDGSGNNLLNPTLGKSDEIYLRVAKANYADDGGIVEDLPNARFISNRVFNDLHINLFSENNASHLSFVWGQFLDHTFGLAGGSEEAAHISFDNSDPLEDFQNDFGSIRFHRSANVEIDGQTEQINTISSYIDGWAVYGGTEERLEWLREGEVDGDLSNNSAKLLLPDGYLPRADARGDHTTAPHMHLMSRLMSDPASAIIAGDIRANENTGLTAMQTLFAREHNRIVDLLPNNLDEETKFQIARKVVVAEQQYITYNEFLPSLGVELNSYQGYDSSVNPSITNEFATVGYRAHSMVHGDFDFDRRNLSDADLAVLESQGVLKDGGQIEVPVNAQSGNPSVVNMVGLGAIFEGLTEHNYNNDEQIDNQLRSIMFQIPQFGNDGEFTDGPPIEKLFNGVLDIGSIDIQRGRDHGIGSYNDVREAFGLEPVSSFYEITGEDPEAIKAFVDSENLRDVDGSRITSADLIFDAKDINLNDPSIIDFVAVLNGEGEVEADAREIAKLLADNEEVEGISDIRRSTVAARLEAVYGDIDDVDAFTGMIAEEHIPGTEFGELQLAIWQSQFEDLRDGDRFFYLNDSGLDMIKTEFGISYETTLGDIIAQNTDLDRDDLLANVFFTEPHLTAE